MVLVPLAEDRLAVPVGRPLAVGHQLGVEAVRGARHRRAAAAQLGEGRVGRVVVVDGGRQRLGQVGDAGVVGRVVLRRRAVERLLGGVRREVEVDVGLVVADAVRPAVEPGGVEDVPLDGVLRAARGAGVARVRTVVGDQQLVRLGVDADAERVAEAHPVDLRTGLRRARREHVARGDGVGAVRLGVDAQHLAAQVVGVGRGALGVPGGPSGALVDRGVPVGGERVGVVAVGQPQVAGGLVEHHAAAVVAALGPLYGHLQHDLLAGGVERQVRPDGEAREPVHDLGLRRVVQVRPAVRGERRVEGHAEQSALVGGEDVQVARGDDAAVRLDRLHVAEPVDVEDGAISGDVQHHRVGGVVVEGDLLERRVQARRAVGRHHAGGGLQAAQQHLQEVRLCEGLVGVAQRGVPGTTAVVVLAPAVGVVGAHRAAAVAGLVHGGQDVDRATRVGAEVVPLVVAGPAVGKARGGGVRGVLDLDDGLLRRGVLLEVRADQLAVPGPVVLGVGGRVNAGEPAAALDVVLEGGLLGGVQDVARGRQEDHHGVLGEVVLGEGSGVLGGVDGEAVLLAELLDGRDTRGD